jgi:histidinol dehydrogenase
MKPLRLSAADLDRLAGPDAVAAHLRSLAQGADSVESQVREIVEDVRVRGDEAVLEHTRRLDTGGRDPRPLAVGGRELDDALRALPLDLVAGLQVTIANVAEVAHASTGEGASVQLAQGQRINVREVPVASAAVYVPGGRAPYPSTVAMGVVAARAAGVFDVAVCSPPGAAGEVDAAVLGACRLCGVERVYRMGGAQAIAALAYGTDTIDRVQVIVGPGNLYVQQAKHQLSSIVGIDSFAGPSDLMVILGSGAGAEATQMAALDMLAQAEHGPGTLVVGVACDADSAQSLAAELDQAPGRERAAVSEHPPDPSPSAPGAESTVSASRQHRAPSQGGIVAVVDASDAAYALELANAFAPEHLQLIGADVEPLARRVQSAGCIFVGPFSGTAFGDYVAGSNHVLPTAGSARFASMLSARHFRRTMAEVHIDAAAAAKLARAGVPIARAEGFEWHARSMEARMGDNNQPR